ncbi:hypothetical protein VTJ04DRAFT_1798 [Mycothermus thermophilus]|uniref:uncharacterized protein n=1 Tax=Humicola insolens TaxID=85995 RepID=UPI003743603D
MASPFRKEEAAKAAIVPAVAFATSQKPSDFLESKITAAGVSDALRPEFVNALWPIPPEQISAHEVPARGAFQQYFNGLQNEFHAVQDQHLAIQSFSDIFALLNIIKENSAQPLDDILSAIRASRLHSNLASAKDEELLPSIEHIIRWWLMINVTITDGKISERPRRLLLPGHGHRSVPWPRGKRLSEAIRVTALERLKASGTSNEILPDGLIEETLQTLDLLIPLDNKNCVRWITRKVEDERVDHELRWRRKVERDPEAYYYWLERLLKLSDAFEKTRPKSPMGWYYDRRDMGQWWNYWLVFLTLALTVLFGLVQSVTGLLQVLGVGPGE